MFLARFASLTIPQSSTKSWADNTIFLGKISRRYCGTRVAAPGSEDTELGVLMEPEVAHGEAEVYAGVQA
jgi:hypothetical protein